MSYSEYGSNSLPAPGASGQVLTSNGSQWINASGGGGDTSSFAAKGDNTDITSIATTKANTMSGGVSFVPLTLRAGTDGATYPLKIIFGPDGTSTIFSVDPYGTIRLPLGGNLSSDGGSIALFGHQIISNGNHVFTHIAGGLSLKDGSNSRIGNGVLVGGSVDIANTSITDNSHILLQRTGDTSSVVGVLTVASKTAGVGFTVKSLTAVDAVAADVGTFDYFVYEAN